MDVEALKVGVEDRYTLSDHEPSCVSPAPWLATVQLTFSGWPAVAVAGALTAVTASSAGGGVVITSLAAPWSRGMLLDPMLKWPPATKWVSGMATTYQVPERFLGRVMTLWCE